MQIINQNQCAVATPTAVLRHTAHFSLVEDKLYICRKMFMLGAFTVKGCNRKKAV